jgi:hypothetical protein
VPTNTPNLSIPKPLGNENFNRTNFNQILDAIDTNVKAKLDEKETAASVQSKIDTAIANLISGAPGALDTLNELAEAMGDDPNFATTVLNRLTAAEQEAATHKAEDAIDAHNASNISVADTTGLFSSSDVEGALKEAIEKANLAFTSANNGKTDIATVIGSPATSGDTFTQLKTHIQNNKNTLATNLTNKGQSSVGTETLAALVAKVANVSTGKKFASGVGTTSSSTLNFIRIGGVEHNTYYCEVAGLNFTPSVILISGNDGNFRYPDVMYWSDNTYQGTKIYATRTSSTYVYTITFPAYVSGTAFRLACTYAPNTPFRWIAFE